MCFIYRVRVAYILSIMIDPRGYRNGILGDLENELDPCQEGAKGRASFIFIISIKLDERAIQLYTFCFFNIIPVFPVLLLQDGTISLIQSQHDVG